MAELRPEDEQLAAALRRRRGAVADLARRFRVSIQTASGWGVRRNFPRHARDEAKRYIAGAPNSDTARALPDASDRSTLVAPEGAMEDVTFRRMWAYVAMTWKHRNTTTAEEWGALVANMRLVGKHVVAEPITIREPDGTLRQIDTATGKTPRRKRRQ